MERKATNAIREVRKRDGRVVPFDREKIADAISRAFLADPVADAVSNPSLVLELAAAVEHFLVESLRRGDLGTSFADGVPSIEDVQDTVENVLMEMGHSSVAKTFIRYRQKRAILRDTLRVRREAPTEPRVAERRSGITSDASGLESETTFETTFETRPWQKGRIAGALMREAGLDASLADEIATAVENRVLRIGLERMSTTLIRELVDNELFERGLSARLRRRGPGALEIEELEDLLFGEREGADASLEATIADRILRDHALSETFSAEVAAAHGEGRLLLHDVESPLRLVRAGGSLPRAGFHGTSPRAFRSGGPEAVEEICARLDRLRRSVQGEIRLHVPALVPGESDRGAVDDFVGGILTALTSTAGVHPGSPSARTVVELDLSRHAAPWLRALVASDSDAVAKRARSVCLRAHPDFVSEDGALLRGLVADLARTGVELELSPQEDRRVDKATPWSFVLGKVTINLPRAAFRSSRQAGGTIEAELDAVLDLAIRALQERRQFVRRIASRPGGALFDLFTGEDVRDLGGVDSPHELVVGLLGLNECVEFLTGRQLHQDSTARERAREILERVVDRVERDAEHLGLRLVVEETVDLAAVRSLETIDARLYGGGRRKDSTDGTDSSWSYTCGVRWDRTAPIDPLERLQRLVAFSPGVRLVGGVIDDIPELSSSDGELLVSLLEEGFPWLTRVSTRGDRLDVGRASGLAAESGIPRSPGRSRGASEWLRKC